MAGTFTQLYIQVVFAVKFREPLLQKPWRLDVFKYMTGIIKEKGHKSIIVNGVDDHVHVFVGLTPSVALSDLVRDIKNNSSRFINQRGFTKTEFRWQGGYGAFSYHQSRVNTIYNYILNQEQHHQQQSFKDEYLGFLHDFEVNYDEVYVFD